MPGYLLHGVCPQSRQIQCKKDSIAFSLRRLFGQDFGSAGELDEGSFVCYRKKKTIFGTAQTDSSLPQEGWKSLKVSDLRLQTEKDAELMQKWQKEYRSNEVSFACAAPCCFIQLESWNGPRLGVNATKGVHLGPSPTAHGARVCVCVS